VPHSCASTPQRATGTANTTYLGLVDRTVELMGRKPLSAEVAAGWWVVPHVMRARDLKPVPGPISILTPGSDLEFDHT